jgi:hypothetical protein
VKRIVLGVGMLLAFAPLLRSPDAEAASAMTTLATELAKGIGQVPPAAVVVASPLASDVAGTVRGDELALRVASLAAGKLGGTTRAHDHPTQLAGARAVAGRGGALVYLSLEIARGELRVTADLYPVMSNGWDRIRIPAPPPRAHAFVSVPLDAEVRAFLPAITLEQAQLHKARHEEGEVLAAACGDADGDGGMDLVLVSKARVSLGNVRGDKFVVRKASPWSGLSRRAPVPLREPLAGAAFVPTTAGARQLLVGSTERESVALDAQLAVRAAFPGIPLPFGDADGCASVNAEASAFEGDVSACLPDRQVRLTAPAPRYDALAVAEITARDGKSHRVVAAREPGGRLRLRLDGGEVKTMEAIGAQLAVGDLDLDGVSEIVTSSDGPDDMLTILSYAGAEPKVRKKIAAPAGIRALAICPPEVRGVPSLVAVVGSEVWVVR